MNHFRDEFCAWEFKLGNHLYDYSQFKQISILQHNREIKQSIDSLNTVITTFQKHGLINFNRVDFDGQIYDLTKKDWSINDLIETHNDKFFSLEIGGTTSYRSNDTIKNEQGLIDITYHFPYDSIFIRVYSDFLLPYDYYDEEVRIQDATELSDSFEKCLREIKSLKKFVKIYPDEGEFSNDYMSYQLGFRLYYSHEHNDGRFEKLTQVDQKRLAKFYLPKEYRNLVKRNTD